jgi:hypothetical protein
VFRSGHCSSICVPGILSLFTLAVVLFSFFLLKIDLDNDVGLVSIDGTNDSSLCTLHSVKFNI